jgi:hypothetical protein
MALTAEDLKQIGGVVDSAFIRERVHTMHMIQESAEEVKQAVRDEFADLWEHNLEPILNDVHANLKKERVN